MPGDELSITYLSEEECLMPTFMRRAILDEKWHFTCECNRCSEKFDPSRLMRYQRCHYGAIGLPADAKCASEAPLVCKLCNLVLTNRCVSAYLNDESFYIEQARHLQVDLL